MSRPSSYAIANSPSVPMNAKDHKNQARSCAILGRLVLLFSAASRNHGAHVSATLSSASASTRRVFEILDTPEEVKDRPEARPVLRGLDVDGPAGLPTSADAMFAPAGATAGLPGRPLQIYGNVAYDDVSFDYDPSRPALRHVSFKLLAGTSAAIIGPSGAGKTTLLNLLPR